MCKLCASFRSHVIHSKKENDFKNFFKKSIIGVGQLIVTTPKPDWPDTFDMLWDGIIRTCPFSEINLIFLEKYIAMHSLRSTILNGLTGLDVIDTIVSLVLFSSHYVHYLFLKRYFITGG